jgi:hypothetical protein
VGCERACSHLSAVTDSNGAASVKAAYCWSPILSAGRERCGSERGVSHFATVTSSGCANAKYGCWPAASDGRDLTGGSASGASHLSSETVSANGAALTKANACCSCAASPMRARCGLDSALCQRSTVVVSGCVSAHGLITAPDATTRATAMPARLVGWLRPPYHLSTVTVSAVETCAGGSNRCGYSLHDILVRDHRPIIGNAHRVGLDHDRTARGCVIECADKQTDVKTILTGVLRSKGA